MNDAYAKKGFAYKHSVADRRATKAPGMIVLECESWVLVLGGLEVMQVCKAQPTVLFSNRNLMSPTQSSFGRTREALYGTSDPGQAVGDVSDRPQRDLQVVEAGVEAHDAVPEE